MSDGSDSPSALGEDSEECTSIKITDHQRQSPTMMGEREVSMSDYSAGLSDPQCMTPPPGMDWMLEMDPKHDTQPDSGPREQSAPSGGVCDTQLQSELEPVDGATAKESFKILVDAIQNGAINLLPGSTPGIDPPSDAFHPPSVYYSDDGGDGDDVPHGPLRLRSETSSFVSVIPMCLYLWSGNEDSDHCKTPLTVLPQDCLISICTFLTFPTVLLATSLSTTFYEAAISDVVWADFFSKRFVYLSYFNLSDVLDNYFDIVDDVTLPCVQSFYGCYPLRSPVLVTKAFRTHYVSEAASLIRVLEEKKAAMIAVKKRRARIQAFLDNSHEIIFKIFWIFILAGLLMLLGSLITILLNTFMDTTKSILGCLYAGGCCLVVLCVCASLEIHRMAFTADEPNYHQLRPESHPNSVTSMLAAYCTSYFFFCSRFSTSDDPPILKMWVVVFPIVGCHTYFIISFVYQVLAYFRRGPRFSSGFGCLCSFLLSPIWLPMFLHSLRTDVGGPECHLAWLPFYIGVGVVCTFAIVMSLYLVVYSNGLSLWYGLTFLVFMGGVVLAAVSSCYTFVGSLAISAGVVLTMLTIAWVFVTAYLQMIAS